MNDTILEMKSIKKSFGPVQALKSIDFKVKRGEIHGLVGENGAGKSTLMKVLSGVYPHGTYSGDIIYKGKTQAFATIKNSEDQGIVIIYQELALIPEMSVYENIYLGHELKTSMGTIDWNQTIAQATQMLQKVGLDVSPETKIKELGVGKKQLVEIAKAFSKNVDLLILDEPTAALNEDDSENLLQLLKELQTQGTTSIIISHKLKEIIQVTDNVTVIRDGETVAHLRGEAGEITENAIIKHMVGREIEDIYPKRPPVVSQQAIAFETKGLNAYDSLKKRYLLQDINIAARKGEVVGIAGIVGAGRTEFAYSVFGNPRGYDITGDIYINGEKKQFKSPQEAVQAGIAYVTEDRKGEGLVLSQDIKQNISLANLQKLSGRGGLAVVDTNEEIKVAEYYKDGFNIKALGVDAITGNLSGGNQQKVSISKWLFTEPNILILDEPTRGIDVGAKFEIYTIINELVAKGLTIIIISSELPEVLGMSDRIYVIAGGKLTGELTREEAAADRVMELAVL